ncbi:helix-turn-helix transcriptional regulator [Roseateles sp.]|uniref:helix-turn-helix domain-containing protein n=1 Tax=Roseateles sp. TaxID=1971397 RepID=UPI0032647F44
MNPVRTMQVSLPPVYLHAMSFGQRMISLRRERSLTQQAFADATDIHVQQIKRYEAGTSQPSADALKKIAKCFGVTTDWLLFEDMERGPDEDLRLQFEAMNQFTPEEKQVARAVLEGLLLKHAARQWGGPGGAGSVGVAKPANAQ